MNSDSNHRPVDGSINNRTYSHELGFIDVLLLSLGVFKTRTSRTLLTIVGMAFGIGVVLFLVSLGYGLQDILIGRLVTSSDSLKTIESYYPQDSGLSITSKEIDKIRAFKESAEVIPVAELPGEVNYEGTTGVVAFDIVDQGYFRLSGDIPNIGAPILKSEPGGAVLSVAALKILGLPLDSTVLNKEVSAKIFFPQSNQIDVSVENIKDPLKIRGVITDEARPPFVIITPQVIDRTPSLFQRVLVKVDDLKNIEALRDKLINIGFIISAKLDLVKQATKIMTGVTIVLGAFGITAMIVAAIGMFNTMMIGFLERIYEVGIMKAIGATNKSIRNLFFTESLMIGLAGGAGGIFLGVAAGEIFNFGINILAKNLGGNPITLFIRPNWFLALTFSISVTIGLLAGVFPARKAMRLSPKQAFTQR